MMDPSIKHDGLKRAAVVKVKSPDAVGTRYNPRRPGKTDDTGGGIRIIVIISNQGRRRRKRKRQGKILLHL